MFSLIAVLILMWGITTVSLVWWHWSDTQRSSIANDYHLASAEWAAVLGNEALSVLRLTQSLTRFEDPGEKEATGAAGVADMDRRAFTLAVEDLIHAADKNLSFLESTEKRVGDGHGKSALALLRSAANDLGLAIAGATGGDIDEFADIAKQTENFNLRAEQLRRLHIRAYSFETARANQERQRNQWILFGILATAMVLALALVGAILRQIRVSEAQLRESDLQLRNAARIANLGYAVWDEANNRYLSVSEGYAALAGCTPAEFIARYGDHHSDAQLVHPEDRERYRVLERKANELQVTFEIEYRLQVPDGSVRHVLEIAEPIFDRAGRMTRSMVILLDITNLKKAEEQLLQAQKTEAIGQLTGGVAHDFNNLLAIIQGNLELLDRHSAKDDRARKLLKPALRAVQRGASLTHQLLAFARKQPLIPTVMDLWEQIVSMDDMLRRTLGETIEIEMAGNNQVWPVNVDRHQFEMALLNLAINARDSMPDGGKLTIEIANTRLSDDYAAAQADIEPGEYVMVSVSDTGSGMPKEVCDKVFEPFFTTKAVGQGTGLGLAMVYGFVKQSNGHISVYSEEGEGTTFKVYLPRAYGAGTHGEAPIDADSDVAAGGETVLVVEDDVDVRILVVTLLGERGYSVIEVPDAKAALEQLESEPAIDLLLTDLILPGGMNGRQLADKATAMLPGLAVLFMSGYSATAILHQGRLDRGVHLLNKPFRGSDLAKAVRVALDKPNGN